MRPGPHKKRKISINSFLGIRQSVGDETLHLREKNIRLRRQRDDARKNHGQCHAALKNYKNKVNELESRLATAKSLPITLESIVNGPTLRYDVDFPFTQRAARNLLDMIREMAARKIREMKPPSSMCNYEICNRMGRSLDTQIGNGLERIITISGKYKKIWKDNQKLCHYQNDADNPYKQYGGKYADVANSLHTVECKSSVDSVTGTFKKTLLDGLKRRNNGTFTRKVRGRKSELVPKYTARWVVLFGDAAERAQDEKTYKLDTIEFWKSCGINYNVVEMVWLKKFELIEREIQIYYEK